MVHAKTRRITRDNPPELYAIEIRTGNWSESIGWYRDVLGLRSLIRVVEDNFALLQAGPVMVSLLARQNPGEATARISLAFEVEDLTGAVDRLVNAGAALTHVRRDGEEYRDLMTTDPDGNRIRLFCWPTETGSQLASGRNGRKQPVGQIS